jgi:hypothetical protein
MFYVLHPPVTYLLTLVSLQFYISAFYIVSCQRVRFFCGHLLTQLKVKVTLRLAVYRQSVHLVM